MKLALLLLAVGGPLFFLFGTAGGAYLAVGKVRPVAVELGRQKALQAAAAARAEAEARAAEQAALRRPTQLPVLDLDRLMKVARELERWSTDLEAREQRVLRQEQAVRDGEAGLARQREALEGQRREIAAFQDRITRRLTFIEKAEESNLQRKVELLNALKPEDVVGFLRAETDAQAARLFSFMPEKRVIKLLETWMQTQPAERDRVLRVFQAMRLVVREGDLEAADGAPAAAPATVPGAAD